MKSLLRSSVLALVVFAGYAAFSTDMSSAKLGIGPVPTKPCGACLVK
jgi:hypothetical protein